MVKDKKEDDNEDNNSSNGGILNRREIKNKNRKSKKIQTRKKPIKKKQKNKISFNFNGISKAIGIFVNIVACIEAITKTYFFLKRTIIKIRNNKITVKHNTKVKRAKTEQIQTVPLKERNISKNETKSKKFLETKDANKSFVSKDVVGIEKFKKVELKIEEKINRCSKVENEFNKLEPAEQINKNTTKINHKKMAKKNDRKQCLVNSNINVTTRGTVTNELCFKNKKTTSTQEADTTNEPVATLNDYEHEYTNKLDYLKCDAFLYSRLKLDLINKINVTWNLVNSKDVIRS